jgi:hypothetical protein
MEEREREDTVREMERERTKPINQWRREREIERLCSLED